MRIEELSYRHDFVDELPGDPNHERYSRQVRGALYSKIRPEPVSAPELLLLVPEVAELLKLDPTPTPTLLGVLSGNHIVTGMEPYAACYGGHQFGHWAGQLGDGRAITLGEVTGDNGIFEIQLKGSGLTPYSRGADGRAVLRSSIRELICSEAMHHLGIPTTRALSLVLTGDEVVRDMFYDGNARPEPGAIVCRVAPSFLRFGSFELPASRGDLALLQRLLDYTIKYFFPDFTGNTSKSLAGFFREVCLRTARLMVEWMRVGFVHGVMNTDNMSILGLTMDYGPYGWVEPFDPRWTPNTTDAQGRRYCFGNQPRIAHWNLAKLGSALAELIDDPSPLQAAIDEYGEEFSHRYREMMLAKIGLSIGGDPVEESTLLEGLSGVFGSTEIDMTLFFRKLAVAQKYLGSKDKIIEIISSSFYEEPGENAKKRISSWLDQYLRLTQQGQRSPEERTAAMNKVNPLYVPRNYLLHEVIKETASGDRTALPALLGVLRSPYEERPGLEKYAEKRPDWARQKAGCSMLSCSS